MAKKFRPRHARDANQKQPDVREDPARSPAALLQCALAAVVGWLIVWAFLDPQDAVSVFLGNALPQNLGWLFAGALAAGLVLFGRGFRFETKYLWVAMAALGWLCVVTLVAGMENNPRRAWFGFWQVMTIGCAYLAIRQLDWGSHSRTAICLICLSGCAAVSFQGLYQVLIGFPQARAEYEQDSQGVLKALQIDPSEGSPGRLRFESRLYSPEPYASYALANSLAVVLSGGLVFALWLIGKHLLAGSAKPPLLMACGLYLAAIVICWFLTRSRTAYVAVALSAVATGAMVWWHGRFAKSSSRSFGTTY